MPSPTINRQVIDDARKRERAQRNGGGGDAPAQGHVDALNRAPLSDRGMADAFRVLHGDDWRYCATRKGWMHWNGDYWHDDDEGGAHEAMRATARARMLAAAYIEDQQKRGQTFTFASRAENAANVSAALVTAQTMPAFVTTVKRCDVASGLLATKGATVDLRTGRAREPRRADMITIASPVAFNPTAQCPRWTRFLADTFSDSIAEDPAFLPWFQRAIGYSLTGDTREQKIFVCYGANGENGKSTMLGVLAQLMGGMFAHVSMDTFAPSARDTVRDDLAGLRNVRMIAASETDEGRRLSEARVKFLTGGDAIRCRFLYGRHFEYVPRFKIWLTVNHKPVISDTTNSIWRRIALIPFNQSFSGPKRDNGLADALRSELPGILNWCVEGAREWYRAGLGTCPTVDTATADYRADSDTLAQWLDACCTVAPSATMPAKAGYASYAAWADESGIRHPWAVNVWSQRMAERFERVRSASARGFAGVGLLTA